MARHRDSSVRSAPRGEGVVAFGGDHLGGAFGQFQVAVYDCDLGAGAGQEQGGGAAVADAIANGTAAGDDGDFAGEAFVFVGIEGHGGTNCGCLGWINFGQGMRRTFCSGDSPLGYRCFGR